MGWKGAVRSINASIKAAKRENARYERERIKQRKIDEKNRALRDAQLEYKEFNDYCKMIQTLHHECSDPIDWNSISKTKGPKEPRYSKKFEKKASENKNNYKPGVIVNLP